MDTKTKTLEDQIAERVQDELTAVDVEALYDEMLDECYDFASVGGPFAGMSASRVLSEADPVAYRCGLNDYQDSLSRDGDYEEIDEELYQAAEVQDIRDEVEAAETERTKP